jgi:hypothetical protein
MAVRFAFTGKQQIMIEEFEPKRPETGQAAV